MGELESAKGAEVYRAVWEHFPEDYPAMEFRLVYEGPLRAASQSNTRNPEKQAIRRALHFQLGRLWEVIPNLKMRTADHTVLNPGGAEWNELHQYTKRTMASSDLRQNIWKTLGDKFDRCGYKFVPLVSQRLRLSCGLEILFLRRDMPGISLVSSGGDIDNRIKVLLDALRIPGSCDELKGTSKALNEGPYFFCLMEDDSMITDLMVTTDTLLTPVGNGHEHDVHLVIKVKVRPTEFSFDNLGFLP